MSRGEKFPAIATLFLLLLLPFLFQDPASGDMTRSLFRSMPVPVSGLASNGEPRGEILVLSGSRPEGDRPVPGTRICGRKGAPGDWLLAEGAAAVWVTGISAPEPGRRIYLAAKPEPGRDGSSLVGLEIAFAAEREGTTVIRPGELAYYELMDAGGRRCSAEVSGGAAETADAGGMRAVLVRGITPGVAKVRILVDRGGRSGTELLRENSLRVEIR
ncbi:MAG: hypothetical protein AB1346_00560 [Thermodesulfobacteriota bacterium]